MLAGMAEQAGLDPAIFRVASGRNAINPRTGQMEFAESYGPSWPIDRDQEIGRRAQVIFGEARGLSPRSDIAGSADQLETARENIGVVSARNPRVHSSQPDFQKPLDRPAWAAAVQAGTNSMDVSLDTSINRFYLRQDKSDQKIPTYTPLTPPLGPFNNVGGGDVPKGPETYIDFYTDRRRK